jgi:hypothetical protein
VKALDAVWWLDHQVTPQMLEDMPYSLSEDMRVVMQQRDLAAQEDQNRAGIAQAHADKMAAQGMDVHGRPLKG